MEMNNKIIKNICSNLKYKTTTFIPNKTNERINNTINNHNINSHFQRNTLNNTETKPYNPFNLMNQPISPMALEMETFKKMKMRERKKTEKNLKNMAKRDYNNNKREKSNDKIYMNNKSLKNENNFEKHKEYFQTQPFKKYERNDSKAEKNKIQKVNKETTIEVDNNIYHVNYNNSNKNNILINKNDININPQEYISVNNSIDNNNIYSFSLSVDNLNEDDMRKEKDSLRNNKIPKLYNYKDYNSNILKTSSFITYDSKNEEKNYIDKKINLNKFTKIHQNKSLGFHKIKSNKVSNIIGYYQINSKNKIKKNNLRKYSNLNMKQKEKIKNEENSIDVGNKNFYSKEQLLEKVKLSKNIRKNSKSIHPDNNFRKDNIQLIKEKLFKIFENFEINKIKIMKERFQLWKHSIITKDNIKANSNLYMNINEEIKINDSKSKKSDTIKYKELILSEKYYIENKNGNEVLNKNDKEFKKEIKLSNDLIIKNKKEDEISSQSNEYNEYKKSFNVHKNKINIMNQKKQSKININNANVIIKNEKQENEVNNNEYLNIEQEIRNKDLKKKERKAKSNIELVNNQKDIKKENEKSKQLNRIILNNKISDENKLIKGFEIIKQYYYNKLMKYKIIYMNKMKISNNENKKKII